MVCRRGVERSPCCHCHCHCPEHDATGAIAKLAFHFALRVVGAVANWDLNVPVVGRKTSADCDGMGAVAKPVRYFTRRVPFQNRFSTSRDGCYVTRRIQFQNRTTALRHGRICTVGPEPHAAGCSCKSDQHVTVCYVTLRDGCSCKIGRVVGAVAKWVQLQHRLDDGPEYDLVDGVAKLLAMLRE